MANVPDKSKCFRLMCEMEMLEHIVVHSITVQRVALTIADAIIACGVSLDRPLIRAAALLHDITKTRSFETREDHARTGGEYLCEQGYPEVGDAVAQHVRLSAYHRNGKPTPAEIVNYADKRVLHDRIVSMKRRMAYIVERYGDLPDLRCKLDWMWEKSIAMEQKLFRNLPFPPERIEEHLPADALASDLAAFRTVRAGYPLAPS